MRRRIVAAIGLAAAALTAGCATSLAGAGAPSAAPAGSAARSAAATVDPGTTAPARATAAAAAAPASVGPSSATAPAARQAGAHTRAASAEQAMLIVGASYTQGLGATTRSAGYAYQVGGRLGWRTDVDGVSGTGFVNPGPHDEGTFGQRLARITPPFEPTMVLIQGGRNDAGIPVATLRTAVDGTVSLCHHRFPKAEVAFLGPVPGKLPLDPAVSEVEHVLRDAAADDHVVFIDPIAEQWIDEGNLRGFTGPVAGHPNDAGYAYIAQRLAVDLKDWQQNDTV